MTAERITTPGSKSIIPLIPTNKHKITINPDRINVIKNRPFIPVSIFLSFVLIAFEIKIIF